MPLDLTDVRAARERCWTQLAQFEDDLEAIIKTGKVETARAGSVVRLVIEGALAEFAYRRLIEEHCDA